MHSGHDDETRPRVLFSFREPGTMSNPFIALLLSSLGDRVAWQTFSWKTALTKKFDVFHVHWPEMIIEDPAHWKRAVKIIAGIVMLAKFRLVGTRVVWTVHNLQSHDSATRLTRFWESLLTRRADRRIYLNDSAENDMSKGEVILHGTYSEWYEPLISDLARIDRQNSLLYFGQIRPYKGLESLLQSFANLMIGGVTLRLMGRPVHADYAHTVEAIASGDDRVSLSFRHVSDRELAIQIRSVSLVVLPYTQMYNSGSMLLALSLGTPVLAPRTPANEAQQAEFGPEWVILFDSPLDASDLSTAFEQVSQTDREPVSMARRNWQSIGDAHRDLYRGSLQTSRSGN
jgi:beta-1,4-mannosyltransferase